MIIPPGSPFHGQRFEGFQQLAIQAKAHGSLILGQVSHPGRQVERSLEPNPLSASDVQLETEFGGMKFNKPRSASLEDIKDIIDRFTYAAEYLHRAGFDGIQLHGAHGYLLAQFLSQTTNKRSDQYGGSLYNRARIILDIARSIRKKLPSSSGFILGIKINSVEFQQDGFTTAEAKELCQLLEQYEFDFVELSGGTYQSLQFVHKRDSTRKREAFFLEFADKIVPVLTKTRAYITGGFKTLDGMVNALKTVDGVGLGRPLCQEFRLVKEFLHDQNPSGGAILPILDQDDFGTTVVVARAQIKQVGKDQEPTDMSVQENVDAFLKDMGTWTENVKLGIDRVDGIVDLLSVKAVPYGSIATV
jgi:2,4-dienoyl-CoA reductase-like NADH-dependent reductase (Old Yellow Enzyme family)